MTGRLEGTRHADAHPASRRNSIELHDLKDISLRIDAVIDPVRESVVALELAYRDAVAGGPVEKPLSANAEPPNERSWK
ncbi:hypothetical protein PI86_02420 [Burkholderia sp. A9]|nr:hypothetical protein PI86_02420 [Burkholderia sp. A9]